MLDAGQVTYGFLQQLLQIKRGQPSGQDKRPGTVLDTQSVQSPAKMGVALQMLPRHGREIIPFLRMRRGKFG
jgi:hypothetical protein